MSDLIGKKLGDFIIQERIGRGGAAIVYRAEQPSMKREVAIKVINVIEASEHGDFYKRFEREAALIASLEHANILPVHDYGIEGNWAYMAMRYLRGGTLKELIQKGALDVERTLELFEQIASGMAYAHSKGIIHPDLKPSNILLDEEGNAYLTDFGLAKMVKGDGDSTQSGQIVGTITNMAPEQLRGEALDHRADIYGLGTILYEMAVGTTPFRYETQFDIITMIYKHLEDDPEPPSFYDPNIPPELEATIMKSIAKRPDERFSSAAEMLASLTPLKENFSRSTITLPPVDPELLKVASTTDASLKTAVSKTTNKNIPLMATALVALLVIVIFVGIVILNDQVTMVTSRPFMVLTGVTTTSRELSPTIEQIALARTSIRDGEQVAIIACNLSSEYHATLNREIRTFLLDAGIDNKVYDSDSDAYDQIPILEQAMAEGAKGIILCPLDYSLLDDPLSTVQGNQLPFVLLARQDNLYGGVQLGSDNDNYSMGYTVGQYAGQVIHDEKDGQACVVILDFPDMEIIVERANGLEEGVLSVAPDVEIVGRYLGATAENGEDSIESLLEEGIEFDVILSINDAGSYGAIDALESMDILPDEVMIFSIDAERRAVDFMREGRFIRGSLSVGREETAKAAANMMVLMLAGEDVPQSIMVESGAMVTNENLVGQP